MSLLDDLKKRQQNSQPTASIEEPKATHDIEKNLAVNPPVVEGTAVGQVAAKSETAPEGTPCPTCGKTFKHLSRHKCKKANNPEAAPASAVTFPTDSMLDVILPVLHGPKLDEYVSQYGITRYNPGDDPKFRETIKRLIAKERDGVVEESTPTVEAPHTPDGQMGTREHGPKPTVVNIKTPPGTDEKAFSQAVAKQVEKDTAPKPEPGAPCFDLIIGAEIVQSEGTNVVHFYDISYLLDKKIKEAVGLHWAEMEFGKGKAALCECLNMMIQEGEFNSKTIVVATLTPAYIVVADTLRQYARNVIVGV